MGLTPERQRNISLGTIPSMQNLTLGDLRLSLKDVLDTHAEDVALSITGKVYYPLLAAKRAEIEALPDAVIRGVPLATELAETDALHDGVGAAIYHFTQAILLHPRINEVTKDTAMRAQKTFVPALGVLSARYAEEAAHANRKRIPLADLRPLLEQLKVPCAGESLYDWISSFLDLGDTIGDLLHGRSEAYIDIGKAPHAGVLRASSIGLLRRFRQAIRDEVASGAPLPDKYEARLFAFIDQLSQTRAQAERRRVAHVANDDAAGEMSEEPVVLPGDEPPPACG